MIPEAEATGRCEVRPESYVCRIATDKSGLVTGVHYFDGDAARTLPEGARGDSERQRRRDTAAAAHVGERTISARPRQCERRGREVPHVQLLRTHRRSVRARAERAQERAGHAHPARLLRQRPETRFLWRRRNRCAHADRSLRCGRSGPRKKARHGAASTRRDWLPFRVPWSSRRTARHCPLPATASISIRS